MTAQIGADGLDLLGDPLPELLTDVAGVQPQPGGEWVHLKDRLRLSLNSAAGDQRRRRQRGGGDVAG